MTKKHKLRTQNTSNAYVNFIASGGLNEKCVLCEKQGFQTFQYWKVIVNDFPYDRIADMHHMLVPIRHCTELELTEEELIELRDIKQCELGAYEFIMEATPHIKSIPAHFHLHLIRIKEFS